MKPGAKRSAKVTCRVPIQTPFFDEHGHLTRTWVLFFEKLCHSIETTEEEPPDEEIVAPIFRYHAYTKRDGRLYFNRLEIDRPARLVGISFAVDYIDERSGDGTPALRTSEVTFAIDPVLFATGDRTKWEVFMDLPQASVKRIRARLETATRETAWVYSYPVGTDSLEVVPEPDSEEPPPPVRTMGHRQYQLSIDGVRPQLPGATEFGVVNAFTELKATEPQTFYRAYAEIPNFFCRGQEPPLDTPGTVSLFEFTDFKGEGFLRFPEAPPVGKATLRVTGDAEIVATVSVSDLEDMAAKLNEHPLFGGYFLAEAADPDIKLTPLQNYLGTLSMTGIPDATVEGFTAAGGLGIKYGRKYTAQATGSTRSSQSAKSYITGPCPAASKIVIHGCPQGGGEITGFDILASPDGADAPFLLVTSIAAEALTAIDTTAETGLVREAGEGPEASAPTRDGTVFVAVYRNGAAWFDVTITADKQRSDIVTAETLGRLEEGTVITADIRYVLDAPPSHAAPGRPNDVRLVFE